MIDDPFHFTKGFIKFTRKLTKMGQDFILWIPKTYVRNGLVETNAEYEIYVKKIVRKDEKA